MTRHFGLIGYPLTHSFSGKFFAEKFTSENLIDHKYDLFNIREAAEMPTLFEHDEYLEGLNVTIPHKETVLPFLSDLDESAQRVGAVNVIKKTLTGLVGYNSDYYGFRNSLLPWLQGKRIENALILGTGGASKAVKAVLDDLSVSATYVSRNKRTGIISYKQLAEDEIIRRNKLIINTTPLGMFPKIDDAPNIDYSQLSSNHYCYDLLYNPPETRFLMLAKEQGAQTKNGEEMLVLQAEKSWEIWNS